jgi:hypothetical protein
VPRSYQVTPQVLGGGGRHNERRSDPKADRQTKSQSVTKPRTQPGKPDVTRWHPFPPATRPASRPLRPTASTRHAGASLPAAARWQKVQTRCTGCEDTAIAVSKSPQAQQAAMLNPVRLEYFEDPSLPAPVLLLYGENGIDPDEVTVLRRRVQQLAEGAAENLFQVDGSVGCLGVEGCSLVAEVAV